MTNLSIQTLNLFENHFIVRFRSSRKNTLGLHYRKVPLPSRYLPVMSSNRPLWEKMRTNETSPTHHPITIRCFLQEIGQITTQLIWLKENPG